MLVLGRYCILGDGCNMEGISNEAASLAGHWGLGKLICLYDDNHISIDGHTDISFTEDVVARFDALGWHTIVGPPPPHLSPFDGGGKKGASADPRAPRQRLTNARVGVSCCSAARDGRQH